MAKLVPPWLSTTHERYFPQEPLAQILGLQDLGDSARQAGENLSRVVVHEVGSQLGGLMNTLGMFLDLSTEGDQFIQIPKKMLRLLHAYTKEIAGSVYLLSGFLNNEEELSLQGLQDHIEKRFNSSSNSKSEVMVSILDDQGQTIVTNTTLLTYILNTIINNALYYVGSKREADFEPRVQVKLRLVKARSNNEANLQLQIADNADPIPLESRDRIFDRGVSGRDSTGLGLWMVSKFVKFLGGQVAVDHNYVSQDSNFTKMFSVEIPVKLTRSSLG